MTAHALLVAAVLTLALATPAAAHVVSDRDLAVVGRMPEEIATGSLSGAVPDGEGCVSPNRASAWRSVGFQRGALLLLVDAAARGDSARAERCWAALERAFVHQRVDGGFGPDTSVAEGAEALWLAAVSRGLIAVMNSRLQDRFRWRYALLKPKLLRAMDAFERRHEAYAKRHARRPALLLGAAAAFLLADGIYHDERYGRVGQRDLVEALALQRSDGAFAAAGPTSVEDHAVALGALQSIVIYFPAPSLERAAERATAWLRRAPRPRGAAGARRSDPIRVPGEIEFVLGYGAIRPPAATAVVPH